jgi:hypothetical protein
MMYVPNVTRPKFCSAKVSATGVISDQNGGCFASCTNATTPVCTFNTGYWGSGVVPNCWVSADSAGGLGAIQTATTTTFSGELLNSAFAPIAVARKYFCQGSGQ